MLFRSAASSVFDRVGLSASDFGPGRIPFGAAEPVVVNVNIAGSLLAQQDLVAAVTDAVYQTQRTGNPITIAV